MEDKNKQVSENKKDIRDCTIPSQTEIESVYPERDGKRVEAILNMGTSGTHAAAINMIRIEPHSPGSA
jgi:hypothetical protein